MKLHRHETSQASDFTVSEVIRLNSETEGFPGSGCTNIALCILFHTIVSADVEVDLNQGASFKCTVWRELKVQ